MEIVIDGLDVCSKLHLQKQAKSEKKRKNENSAKTASKAIHKSLEMKKIIVDICVFRSKINKYIMSKITFLK